MIRIDRSLRLRVIGGLARASVSVVAISSLGFCLNVRASHASPAPRQKAPASKWVAQMPEGAGKNVIVAKCQFCHTLQSVVTARRTKDQWTEAIDSMTQMGAPITSDEASTIVDYLSANFGPAGSKPPAQSSASPIGTNQASTNVADNILVDPDRAQFSPLPDSLGSSKGVEMFVVSGDPLKRGPFSILLKISAGGIVQPNWFSGTENIVCLRGAIQLGEGDSADTSKLQTLNPGTVLHIAGASHRYRGEARDGAIVLISGDGPLASVEK